MQFEDKASSRMPKSSRSKVSGVAGGLPSENYRNRESASQREPPDGVSFKTGTHADDDMFELE